MNTTEMLMMCDKDTERRVLSSIVCDGKMLLGVRADYFTGHEKQFYEDIATQWNDHGEIDIQMVFKNSPKEFQKIVDHTSNYGKNAISSLKNAHLWRLIGKTVVSLKGTNASKSIDKMLEILGSANLAHSGSKYVHNDAVSELLEAIDRGCTKEEGAVQGYSTGFRSLNNATSGIEKGKFYVLGALKKTGKSRFMINLAIKLSLQGAGVLLNSLEMRPIELNALALSFFSGINSALIGRKLPMDLMSEIGPAMGKLSELNWSINRDYYVHEIRSRILYERQKRKLDVIFIDFLQRMKCGEYKGDRTRSVENIAMGLADIAKEMNVAVVALCQLSGEAERLPPDVVPDMKYFKESQGIAENADGIITMHNPTRLDIQPSGAY
ncbi:MAG TPA: DnaB-like helicase C-terminal domain-containing protein, partial [Anaerolineae bacterium]|nr:DnaB-like helicase C-terminal domain-containing protein [Anaerolineae bacterium]